MNLARLTQTSSSLSKIKMNQAVLGMFSGGGVYENVVFGL